MGIIIGTAQILCSMSDKSGEEYKNFVETARRGRMDGSVNCVIRKTYVKFYDEIEYVYDCDTTTGMNLHKYRKAMETHEYAVWNSSSQLKSPKNSSGTWTYTFE